VAGNISFLLPSSSVREPFAYHQAAVFVEVQAVHVAHLFEEECLEAGTFVSAPRCHPVNRTQPQSHLHCKGERE